MIFTLHKTSSDSPNDYVVIREAFAFTSAAVKCSFQACLLGHFIHQTIINRF